MSRQSFGLDPDINRYLNNHSEPPSEVQRDLIAATAELGMVSGMQIGPSQGAFLEVIVGAVAPAFAVEVGTFTGFSSLAIAKSLAPGGTLLCCDVSTEWTAIASDHWHQAGLADRIELKIAPAGETLRSLPERQHIDFAFIDADKPGYIDYYEELVPRLTDRGLIAVDNTIWGGQVIDDDDSSENTVAVREFNAHVAEDERTLAAMLSIGDGVTLIRRR